MPDETNPGAPTGVRRAQAASLRRVQEIRAMLLAEPSDLPPGITDAKLAMLLTAEMTTVLVRQGVLLEIAAEALIAHEQALTKDLEAREAAAANEQRWSRLLERLVLAAGACITGLATYAAGIANDPKVRAVLAVGLASLVAAGLGALTAWFGFPHVEVTLPIGGAP